MSKDEIIDMIKEIGTLEDETERRTRLASLSNEVSTIYDERDTLKTENNSYQEDNEKLRSANMELFLQIGGRKTDEEIQTNSTGIHEETIEPRKFENLFNEKGELKL